MGTLRFILALSVVFGHGLGYIHLFPVNGDAAVYCFFIISGYYMALVLDCKYNSYSKIYLFYVGRCLKIFPSYLFVCLIIVLYRFAFESNPFNGFSNNGILSTNLFIFGMDSLRFQTEMLGYPSDWRLIPQAWSLDIELTFYLLAPFILIRTNRYKICLFLIVSIFVYQPEISLPWSFASLFIFKYLLFFISGAISYHVWKHVKRGLSDEIMGRLWMYLFVMIFSVVLYAYSQRLWSIGSALDNKNIPIYISLFFIIPLLFDLTKNNALDRRLGEFSYPMYIVHGLPIKIMGFYKLNVYGVTSSIMCALSVMLLSWFLMVFIDKPIESLKSRMFIRSHQNV